jgi:hypothetical protein
VDYLDELEQRWGHDYLSVVIAEFVLPHWYQGVFHNQSALALRLALRNRPDTVVVNVPFHLHPRPDTLGTDAETLGLDGPEPGQHPTIVEIPAAQPTTTGGPA